MILGLEPQPKLFHMLVTAFQLRTNTLLAACAEVDRLVVAVRASNWIISGLKNMLGYLAHGASSCAWICVPARTPSDWCQRFR